jgi:hypothetical protein
MMQIIECDQGTPEWHAARCGIPTASRFKDILAKGELKMRNKYLRDLAAEVIRGTVEEDSFSNAHMERGKEQEAEARDLYAFARGVDPTPVGFVRNGRAGCSPDSFIGDDGGLEIKTALGHIQIERLQKGTLPTEHIAQVQGGLWITGRKWWDFTSYSRGLPPLIVRVERDEEYIAKLAAAVDAFNQELDSIVQSIRTYQDFKSQAAA